MAEDTKFNPSEHLMKLKGKEYLEVKFRLVWFEQEHSEGSVVTELVSHDLESQTAVFKASVSYMVDGAYVIRTGYGMEERSDFGDYLEKAETKAIGRALAVAGYGTQFCDDLDFGGSDGRVVDSPVAVKPKGTRTKLMPVARG